ncbi:chemoreceptor glutamine deamidase CheD [Magnetospirillum molischianum]|uniref:Probable chemoreceptor glutamine deamidase CheD n=1 Tax=Magnetospirillum molischianum DSM 120 TaxID=1150626 RepID=H8FR09_MAGML|nr:chemoreceptor glutamine deamidase CheD [Magnetospirillum molischianum]CCG40797.1 Chemotaxis protein cheD [Magnetospirillum molischianum DSM 120]
MKEKEQVWGSQAEDAERRRWFDPTFKIMAVKVLPGEHYVSTAGQEMIVTVLGSCVAACIWDPRMKIGGMNHFMLPDSGAEYAPIDKAMRYGNHAMEELINDLLRRGARREALEIKVFGAGNVIPGMVGGGASVGDRNAVFVRRYLGEEGLRLAAEDLGGPYPRRIHFFPRLGKVIRLFLKKDVERAVITREMSYRSRLKDVPVEGDVELFT